MLKIVKFLTLWKKIKKNEIIKINDKKNKIKYIAQKNIKKKINKYDFINNNNEFNNEIKIIKISND